MKYLLGIMIIALFIYGCKNNPIINDNENHLNLEYTSYKQALYWFPSDTMVIGNKYVLNSNDSLTTYEILYYGNNKSGEKEISEEILSSQKRDSILLIFQYYGFNNYPSHLPEKDSITIPSIYLKIKYKSNNNMDYKVVTAYMDQGGEYYPKGFEDFIRKLNAILK